jgi:uncharacterized protein (DUF1697 family)
MVSIMHTYISLLRGINVGGKTPVKMGELVTLYQSLGFKCVRTLLQSGNVIFDSPEEESKKLAAKIENEIGLALKSRITVLVLTANRLREIIQNNPFTRERDIDSGKFHVTFLSRSPDESALSSVKGILSGADRFEIVGDAIYLYCPDGYGKTKYSNNFFEKKLGLSATSRNWNTVKALLQLAENRA